MNPWYDRMHQTRGDVSRELSLSIVIEAESISIPVEIKLIEPPISVGQR